MEKNIRKILVIFVLIVAYIIINLIWSGKAFAVNQTTTTDINSIDSNQYPQIKEILQQLKNQHPNWNFKILYTDIEWAEAIANEYVGHGSSPRNLVPANNAKYNGAWICAACGERTYDSGNWHCASEAAIAYMMDPRNSANYSDIFQFMELTYYDCDVNTIRTMVANTFLNNESYINAIISAGQKYNVNPYYIVARIIQEQGNDGSVLSSGAGYNGQYVGYYNVFNIGASGSGKETVILNGLKKAAANGWDTLEKSIDGGVSIIASSYIAKGQNTLYFQKFDVENSDGNLYWHQYMQNILAAQNEGSTLRKTFESVGSVDAGYTFIIPLFKNMPSTASPRPSTTLDEEIPTNTELVKVNVTNSLRLRNAPNGSTTVGWVYKDEIITRLSKGTEKIGGTYWDLVMKSDGTRGYAARETYDYESTYKLYLVPVEEEQPAKPEVPTTPEEKIEVDTTTNEAKAVPSTTVEEVKKVMGENVVVKNANGEVLGADAKIGTGCVINDTIVVLVLGDVNGDAETTALDAAQILRYTVGQFQLSDIQKSAGILDGTETPTALDAAKILRYTVGQYDIKIQ